MLEACAGCIVNAREPTARHRSGLNRLTLLERTRHSGSRESANGSMAVKCCVNRRVAEREIDDLLRNSCSVDNFCG